MKKLYLIRHAKSDWSDASQGDFERGLNTRGKKAITTMAEILNKKEIMPNIILSSSATRAMLTAKGLAKNINYKRKIKYMNALYFADPQEIIKIIKEIKDKYETVFIVGHNPETTELTNLIADDTIYNVPTLGIVSLNISVQEWEQFKPENTTLDFFIYPKMFKS